MYEFNRKFEADFVHTDIVYSSKPSEQLFISDDDTHTYNRYDLRINYKDYLKTNKPDANCVNVPIFSIEEITPEMVLVSVYLEAPVPVKVRPETVMVLVPALAVL